MNEKEFCLVRIEKLRDALKFIRELPTSDDVIKRIDHKIRGLILKELENYEKLLNNG